MPTAKRVLAVGFDAETEALIGSALAREPFEISHVPGGSSAAALVALIPFDFVLIVFPLAGSHLEEVLAVLRREESPSCRAIVVLIASAQDLAQAESYLACGADRALSAAAGGAALQEEILRLLREKPRLAIRVMIRLTVLLGDEPARFLCQTRDLSRTGCLALTDRLYPLTTRVQFSLDLAEGSISIRGQAKVVRHVDSRRENVEGLGLQFESFEGNGQALLETFLARLGA